MELAVLLLQVVGVNTFLFAAVQGSKDTAMKQSLDNACYGCTVDNTVVLVVVPPPYFQKTHVFVQLQSGGLAPCKSSSVLTMVLTKLLDWEIQLIWSVGPCIVALQRLECYKPA